MTVNRWKASREPIWKKLRNEHADEGMSGIDPRYVINRISSALIRRDTECINALDILRALKEGFDQHPSITKEQRERYMNFISIARKEYDELAKKRSAEGVCLQLRRVGKNAHG